MKRDWSNHITIVLTTVILVGGFVLPNLVYPWLDPFMGRVTPLAPPADSGDQDSLLPSLYPWNIYDEQDTEPLSLDARVLLREKGVPQALVSFMRDHGMPLEDNMYDYTERILSSFNRLNADSGSYEPCFVLFGCDLDADGQPDFRCATNLSGDIIDFLILNPDWMKMQLVASLPDDPEGSTADPEDIAQMPAAGDNEGQGGGVAPEGEEPEGETTGPDQPQGGQSEQKVPENYRLPLQEDLSIWAFAYSVNKGTESLDQAALNSNFHRIDLNFSYRYNFGFEVHLWVESGLSPADDDTVYTLDSYMNVKNIKYPDYNLTIYNLFSDDYSSGTRIILYIHPKTGDCVGFTIQELYSF